MKIKKEIELSNCKKIRMNSHAKLISVHWEPVKFASEKLHCADFTHNPLTANITAVTQIHDDGRKSRHIPKITVFTVIVIPWFSYSPMYSAYKWVGN